MVFRILGAIGNGASELAVLPTSLRRAVFLAVASLSYVTLRPLARVCETAFTSGGSLRRALMEPIVKALPRHLDTDLIRGAGLTASEYTTIMHLSGAEW